jgi:hypothetical protein
MISGRTDQETVTTTKNESDWRPTLLSLNQSVFRGEI